jgi:site-specific recombinase XerD
MPPMVSDRETPFADLVSELLGHASLNSTRIYTMPTGADLARAVKLLHADR